MTKGSEVVYGRGRLARLLEIPKETIRYLERAGKIKTRKESFGDVTFNAYTRSDVEKIKNLVWKT